MRKRTATRIIQATKALDPRAFVFDGHPGDRKWPIIEAKFRASCPAFLPPKPVRFSSQRGKVLS